MNSVAFILVMVQIQSVCRFLRDGELNSEKNPFFRMAHKKIYLLTGVQFRLLFNSAFLAFGAKWSARLCAVLRYLRTLQPRAGIMSAKPHSDGSWDSQSFKRSDLLTRNTETSWFKKSLFSRMVLKITAKSAEMMGVKRDAKPENGPWDSH